MYHFRDLSKFFMHDALATNFSMRSGKLGVLDFERQNSFNHGCTSFTSTLFFSNKFYAFSPNRSMHLLAQIFI